MNEQDLQGRVFRKSIGHYIVHTSKGPIECSISNKLRKRLIYPTADPSSRRHRVDDVRNIRTVDPIAIGDMVVYLDSGDGTGMITEVLPRKNKLSRRASGLKVREQVIVSNVDQVVGVFSARKPKPAWGLLDRYIADAEYSGLQIVVLITKMDLDRGDMLEWIDIYRKIGYPVVLSSVVTGEGLDEFKAILKDKMSVFVGKSGVGKTTILNAIEPGLGLRVNEVSDSTGKGKHTTSGLQMFPLEFGGEVVDTPGMREFRLWNTRDVDIAELFVEMRGFIGHCKYGADCSHTHEPDCAVKAAVENGDIAESRYKSYVKLSGL